MLPTAKPREAGESTGHRMSIFLSTIEQWFWHVWDHLWRLLAWNIALLTLSWPMLALPPAPMLFTSVTTFVGFISLASAPIPPVRVFGVFVGVGVIGKKGRQVFVGFFQHIVPNYDHGQAGRAEVFLGSGINQTKRIGIDPA